MDRVGHFVVNVCKMAVNVEMVHRVMGILATNSANLDLPKDTKEASYGRHSVEFWIVKVILSEALKDYLN